MIVRLVIALILFCTLLGCEDNGFGDDVGPDIELDSMGILDINFVFNIQGIPPDLVKRSDLSLAHSADSMYRGQFFRATNVSDAITKYRFYLPPGEYYYHATIICLAGGDACKYVQFGEQYGLRMDGGKVEVHANQNTEVTTQFH